MARIYECICEFGEEVHVGFTELRVVCEEFECASVDE